MSDLWAGLVGQDNVTALLERSASTPSHAYLFAGAPGSGADAAARCFAAAALCPDGGCGTCSTCRRVLTGRHPDVVEVEPEGASILVGQATAIIEAAFRSPVEGARKIIVIREADRLSDDSANRLLKTFEEPPEPTTFVLVTANPDELLPTVRSRCQVVTFAAAGGDVTREERLAGPLAALVGAFAAAPGRLDGTGGSVATVAADLLEAVDQAFASVKAAQVGERERLQGELEESGYSERDIKRVLKPVVDRHDRVERRSRTDALSEGLAVLEVAYRDALLAHSGPSAEATLVALDAIAAARRALADDIVLNWGLMLERLLLHLVPQTA